MTTQSAANSRIVFISYTTRDQGEYFSKILEDKIEKNTDYIAFRAQTDLKDSDSWSRKIDKVIEDCFVLIAVITPEANHSRWVTYEWAYAAGLQKPIIVLIRSEEAEEELHDKLPQAFHIDVGKRFMKSEIDEDDWQALYTLLHEIHQETHTPPYIQEAMDAARSYDPDKCANAIIYLQKADLPAAERALIELCETSFSDDLLIRTSMALAHKQFAEGKEISPIVTRGLIRGMRGSTWMNKCEQLLRKMDNEDSLFDVYEAYKKQTNTGYKTKLKRLILTSRNSELTPNLLHKMLVFGKESNKKIYDMDVLNALLRFRESEAAEVLKQIAASDSVDAHNGNWPRVIENLQDHPLMADPLLIDLLEIMGERTKKDYRTWSSVYNMILNTIEALGTDGIGQKLLKLTQKPDFYDMNGNASELAKRMVRN